MFKKILQLIVFTGFSLAASYAFAETASTATPATTMPSAQAITPADEQVEQAYNAWVNAIETAKGNPAQVVKLYAPDAILLATFAVEPIMTTAALQDYFAKLTSVNNLKVITTFRKLQDFGDIVICTGLYKFESKDSSGKTQSIDARFTIVYKKFGNQWLIVNHHSSIVPTK